MTERELDDDWDEVVRWSLINQLNVVELVWRCAAERTRTADSRGACVERSMRVASDYPARHSAASVLRFVQRMESPWEMWLIDKTIRADAKILLSSCIVILTIV